MTTLCEQVPYLGSQAIQWRVGDSTYLALPECGARLMRWTFARTGETPLALLHWPKLTSLSEFATARGGNPILFPFCARSFADGRVDQWRDTEGTLRSMPLHGVARQSQFKLTSLSDTGFKAELVRDSMTDECYPFDYRFEVRYEFWNDGFRVEFGLENCGARSIPWSAGHHFYIAFPWRDGLARDEYEVVLPSREAWRQHGDGTLQPVPVRERQLLTSEALIATMHGTLASDELFVYEKGTGARLGLKMPAMHRFPEAVFTTWTLDKSAPYYCLEPWMGPANALGVGRGVDYVLPGHRSLFPVEVRFSAGTSNTPSAPAVAEDDRVSSCNLPRRREYPAEQRLAHGGSSICEHVYRTCLGESLNTIQSS